MPRALSGPRGTMGRMLTLILLACASHTPPAPSATGFRYDPETGRCVNGAGQVGLNAVAIEAVRVSRDAECADLRGVQLLPPSTGSLVGWNLAGADLTGANLHFSDIQDADLRGTDLSAFEYGYVHISGTVDSHTRLAQGCTTEGPQVSCAR